MLSFTEIRDKTQVQKKAIIEALNKGSYHPEIASLYDGLAKADAEEVRTTLNSLSLAEVLINASTVSGSTYLVAGKLYDTLSYKAMQYDICPLVGDVVTGWQGGALSVRITEDGSYVPQHMSSGGMIAEENAKFVSATLTPEGYGIPIECGNDLIEDAAYGIVQWHVEQAGKACGQKATDLMLPILQAGTDGDGTVNTASTNTADTTFYNEILNAAKQLGVDQFRANTMLITDEAYAHYGTTSEMTAASAGDYGRYAFVNGGAPAPNYHIKFDYLDTLFCNRPSMHASTDEAGADFTGCITIILDRNNAILTGRKRWLEVKDYANPIEDIAGAVVTFRQDSVTLYNDAICVLTETGQE
jgi:hypothetical protein